MNTQRMLNEHSTNAQGALNDLIDLPMIFSDLSMNTKFFHPEGKMAESSMSAQGSPAETAFFVAFERSLRDRAIF